MISELVRIVKRAKVYVRTQEGVSDLRRSETVRKNQVPSRVAKKMHGWLILSCIGLITFFCTGCPGVQIGEPAECETCEAKAGWHCCGVCGSTCEYCPNGTTCGPCGDPRCY